LTVADLARRCRNGETRAWGELIKRFTPLVFGVCIRMLRNESEAEDACQETFMRVYRFFSRYDATRPIEPWLSRIAYNVCLQRLQRIGGTPRGGTDPDMTSGPQTGGEGGAAENGIARKETASLLDEALSTLAAQDRAILHMHYWQGFTTAEVSEATDMPVNTVKVRLFRARNRLREFLTPVLRGDLTWIMR